MNAVLKSFDYCLQYLRDQVEDITPPDMVRQPDGVVVHPARVIGHVTFSCQAIGGELGLPPWLPADWPCDDQRLAV